MKKKVVLLTGASSGLGKSLAEDLSDQGYLVYAGIRSEDALRKLKKYWQDLYPKITAIKLDIQDPLSCKKAIQVITKKNGGVDVLINNAGFSVSGETRLIGEEELKTALDINCISPYRLIKLVLPRMLVKKRGSIINITSLNSHISLPYFGVYSASKAAFESLGTAFYYELKSYNVHLTNIAPGAIKREGEVLSTKLSHQPLRERFYILKLLFPIQTEKSVVGKIIEILNNQDPPKSVVVGIDAIVTTLMHRYLPNIIWDKIIQKLYA